MLFGVILTFLNMGQFIKNVALRNFTKRKFKYFAKNTWNRIRMKIFPLSGGWISNKNQVVPIPVSLTLQPNMNDLTVEDIEEYVV